MSVVVNGLNLWAGTTTGGLLAGPFYIDQGWSIGMPDTGDGGDSSRAL